MTEAVKNTLPSVIEHSTESIPMDKYIEVRQFNDRFKLKTSSPIKGKFRGDISVKYSGEGSIVVTCNIKKAKTIATRYRIKQLLDK